MNNLTKQIRFKQTHEPTADNDDKKVNIRPKREKYDSSGIASIIYANKKEVKKSDLDGRIEKKQSKVIIFKSWFQE